MIDVCIVIYRNYDLLKMQFENWDKMKGEFRYLICDNTPANEYRPIPITRPDMQVFRTEYGGIDGERHGGALNFLMQKAESDIVAICDSDFFWLDYNIVDDVQQKFAEGCKCYGVELWYRDFKKVNERYPERAGWLAPCVFGMFIDRDLARSETFVVTKVEGEQEWKETGWRMRQKIIQGNIPCHVITAFKYPEQMERQIYKGSIFYGDPKRPCGFHFVKGSSKKMNQIHLIPELIALSENQ